jgi:hypothetical protein
VQTLEDSICAMCSLCFVWHKPFVQEWVEGSFTNCAIRPRANSRHSLP